MTFPGGGGTETGCRLAKACFAAGSVASTGHSLIAKGVKLGRLGESADIQPASPAADAAPISTDALEVVRAMPRRKAFHGDGSFAVTLPRARSVIFKAGVIRPFGRLLVWGAASISFFVGNVFDILLSRDSTQRRAIRLRRIFEHVGASFTKLGQQLSLRADILPYAYCAELSKMLDQAHPFPTQEAIFIIERNLGRPLKDVFEIFDPEPIGSASLACVYQAVLKTGERVAVKVRRPGIGPLIAADLRALDWLLIAAETLTIIEQGTTRRFRQDLRTVLFNELNFRAEARYTDLFRRRARRRHAEEITAPQVYFQYCTEEVLVSEFVSGVWMWEIMDAVDRDDKEFLLKLSEMGIEPKTLASKLIRVMHHEVLEEIFFHGDPHPANLVVLPSNRICFIDFGAVGRFSTQVRKMWRELHHHMINGDIGRMVSCSINLSGPLPPIDVNRFSKALEQTFADWVYAMKSKDAQWWERSTAQAWLRFMEVAREFNIPVNLETIQFFRATLLYDSIVTRLDRDIDFAREYKRYAKEAAKRARRRIQKAVRKRIVAGPTDMDYLQVEQLADMTSQFLFRLQRMVEEPIVNFGNIVGKISYTMSLLLRLGYWVASAVGIAVITSAISRSWFKYEISWYSDFEWMLSFGWAKVTLILIGVLLIRKVVTRLNLPDSRLDPEG